MFFHNPAVFLDSNLEEFVYSQNFPVTIKEGCTGQYILCNQAEAVRDGITEEDYIGLTAYDIAKKNNIKHSVIEKAVYIDYQIYRDKIELAQYQQVIPTAKKNLLIEEIIKKPVFKKNTNEIIGILGYATDITPYADLMYLFSLYQSYYTLSEAITYFLKYTKLIDYFWELPTREELAILLLMSQSKDLVSIAKELKCNISVVKRYQAQVQDKLILNCLDAILIKLRPNYEYNDINE